MKKSTFRKGLAAFAMAILMPAFLQAQMVTFSNQSSLINDATMRSGNCVTVIDVNFDGLDDIVRMDNGNEINYEIQNRDGSFTNHFIVNVGGGSAWGMGVADFDHNGWMDVVADGSGGIRLVLVSESGGVLSMVNNVLSTGISLLQNVTIVDIDNDGWEDIFLCDDNQASKLYRNNALSDGTFTLDNTINFLLNPGITYGGDPADSGNYGSVWSDFDSDGDMDLYIAKCRQANGDTSDLRRKDILYEKVGATYIDNTNARGLTNGYQTWTGTFGDIDNDGDFDMVRTNHNMAPFGTEILTNDGSGNFTSISLTTGINTTSITPYQSVFEDFDNDGWIDILISGTNWMFFRNNQDNTFTNVTGLFSSAGGLLSYAIGDLNHDGFIDLFTSYGDGYNNPSGSVNDVLYMNNANNDNHFLTFILQGTLSTPSALGALVKIYGPWGIQMREVRTGESYGTCNSTHLHFGLGATTVVDSAVIIWPSGITETLYNINADQFITSVESLCTITDNAVSGNPVICTGQSTTLTASSGFSGYEWNNGNISPSIVASTTGVYNVLVTDANGCQNISPNVFVEENPDETPILSVVGETEFCEGGSVSISSNAAASYLWSNGANTQSINAAVSGIYYVTIAGTCGNFTSDSVLVDVLPAPTASAPGTLITTPQSVTLTATGNDVYWYDAPTGGNQVGAGNTFVTPVISSPTTYYIEERTTYPGGSEETGKKNHTGTSLFSGATTTNASQIFDVFDNCILHSVKLYTDSFGVRIIELKNAAGTLINSLAVDVQSDTMVAILDFPLTPGVAYRLTTNGAQNTALLGYASPRLRRNNGNGIAYPYVLNNLLSITGSDQGAGFYYYFYDWQIELPDRICTSARTPVFVDYVLGIQNQAGGTLNAYPNPVQHELTLANNGESLALAVVDVIDLSGRVVASESFNNIPAGSNVVLNLTQLQNGVYSVRVRSANTEWIKPIVKQ